MAVFQNTPYLEFKKTVHDAINAHNFILHSMINTASSAFSVTNMLTLDELYEYKLCELLLCCSVPLEYFTYTNGNSNSILSSVNTLIM